MVCANGSHADNIAVKLKRGLPPFDALALGLLSWDYEDDTPGTPRIAAILDLAEPANIELGIVRPGGLQVERLPLQENRAYILATNAYRTIDGNSFEWQTVGAGSIAQRVLTGDFMPQIQLSQPIAAVAWQDNHIEIAKL